MYVHPDIHVYMHTHRHTTTDTQRGKKKKTSPNLQKGHYFCLYLQVRKLGHRLDKTFIFNITFLDHRTVRILKNFSLLCCKSSIIEGHINHRNGQGFRTGIQTENLVPILDSAIL